MLAEVLTHAIIKENDILCDKTNEIPISIEILNAFDVSNKVITTDALLTQKPFCQAILNAGGDYLLPVKKNQNLYFVGLRNCFKIHRIQQIRILGYILFWENLMIYTKQLKKHTVDDKQDV